MKWGDSDCGRANHDATGMQRVRNANGTRLSGKRARFVLACHQVKPESIDNESIPRSGFPNLEV